MKKNCIVIPIHNECRTIGPLVKSLIPKGLDVIVVDDGSSDFSGKIARQHGAYVIVNNMKQGKGMSLKKGFAYALERDYGGVITMDGDGQHDVSDIDLFVAQIQAQPDCIIAGSRMGNSQGMPPIRFLTNYFMSFLISGLCRME